MDTWYIMHCIVEWNNNIIELCIDYLYFNDDDSDDVHTQ